MVTKILYITHYADFYGANLSMLHLIIELKKTYGIKAIVLVNKKGELLEKLKKYNIDYIYFPFPTAMLNMNRRYLYIKKIIKCFIKFPCYLWVFLRLKFGKGLDLIHTNTSICDIGYYIGIWGRIPHIWHVREFGKEDYHLIPLNQRKQIQKFQKSDTIIAISDSIKKNIQNLSKGISVERVYNGMEMPDNYIKEYRKEGIFRFCVVGRIQEEKGQMDILKGVKILLDKGYTSFQLFILGSGDTEYIKLLEKYILENNMLNVVKFLGYRDNIQEILQQFDVGIMSSYKEAFGRTTIEYMANYMPVIGTNSGGTKELVEQGSDGMLFYPGDYISLAENMRFFLDNDNIVAKMGHKARNKALNFSVEKNALEIYQIYRRILKG